MSIHQRPIHDELILQLYLLACTPFSIVKHSEQWDSFGWKTNAIEEFGFSVQISEDLSLSISHSQDTINCEMLPFYYWENYHPDYAPNLLQYKQELLQYNNIFDNTVDAVKRLLSPPSKKWTDQDKDAHRAAVWEGDYGLLILQQALWDLQFGIEINFWLLNCSLQEFQPTSPLIDWLSNYNENKI